eukprot:TRINITY_DN10777_c0_g1_i1.p1 TRINITY_DN10777_c0_g1~~TRINITY_DN10777_c0_g1_i1.p1  ORF type:complete len:333 (+),score=75.08 TRINITY_DN10777_c0_g1_i1:88-1086(+)
MAEETISWEAGKKLLVIVNPYGGTGKGRDIWYNEVAPAFKQHNIQFQILETTHKGHAREFLLEADLDQFCGFVIIGGDGSINEALNALNDRPDSEKAIKLPLGVIPAGSGNGLATSLGMRTVAQAVKSITEGVVRPIDLFNYTVGDGPKKIGCLSITWGFVGDHDVLAENSLRWMGPLRLAVIPIYVIMRMKPYHGVIHYLPVDAKSDDESEWKSMEGDYVCMVAGNVAWLAGDVKFVPKAIPNDGCIDIVTMQNNASRYHMVTLFIKTGNGTHIDDEKVGYVKTKGFRIEPRESDGGAFVVDGEDTRTYKTIKAMVMHNAGRVFWNGQVEP